jgi:16S rRNA (guanine527-N7)-methyltransferase
MSEREVREGEVDPETLRSLLRNTAAEFGVAVCERGIEQMGAHFALLLKWSRKINLTSLTRPEEIAVRHFGESLFLNKVLTKLGAPEDGLLVDVGSGAGFPGLPLKVVWPALFTVLLEPNQKKATFLKEVVRSAGIDGVEVRASRLDESLATDNAARKILRGRASIVTMRAVAVSAELTADLRKLLRPGGLLALFLGEEDAVTARTFPGFEWNAPVAIPHSERRVIVIGKLCEVQHAPDDELC